VRQTDARIPLPFPTKEYHKPGESDPSLGLLEQESIGTPSGARPLVEETNETMEKLSEFRATFCGSWFGRTMGWAFGQVVGREGSTATGAGAEFPSPSPLLLLLLPLLLLLLPPLLLSTARNSLLQTLKLFFWLLASPLSVLDPAASRSNNPSP